MLPARPISIPVAKPARRRRQIALWLERYETLLRTPARTEEERLAKHQALEMMEQAYPALQK